MSEEASSPTIDERIAELRREYVVPAKPPYACKPPLVVTYDQHEFVRPRKVISNQCPCCGQPWKLPINARVCPRCGEMKYLHEFTNKAGMCKDCRKTKTLARADKEREYHRKYYREKTRFKKIAERKAKAEAKRLANHQNVINE